MREREILTLQQVVKWLVAVSWMLSSDRETCFVLTSRRRRIAHGCYAARSTTLRRMTPHHQDSESDKDVKWTIQPCHFVFIIIFISWCPIMWNLLGIA